jgi:hypothetical protein
MVLCHLEGFIDFLQDILGKPLPTAKHSKSYLLLEHQWSLADHKPLEQPHQKIEFILRALPILARETKQCQVGDPQSSTGLYHRAHRLGTTPMPFDAGQST